jgi:hypothetical protein
MGRDLALGGATRRTRPRQAPRSGSNALGGLDAGLFFIAYVRDPRTHFIPLQTRMAANDAMMEYLQFTSSAVFAVPRAPSPASTSARRSSPDADGTGGPTTATDDTLPLHPDRAGELVRVG